ncbi:magnesium and cobalt transport protein CorA [Dermabacteraceae bacterium P7074]
MSTVLNRVMNPDGSGVACDSFSQARSLLTEPGKTAVLHLTDPDDAELAELAEAFDLHELAIEDAREGHQRPKLERYGETLFCVLRPTAYNDAAEEVTVGEIDVFVGKNFFITVSRNTYYLWFRRLDRLPRELSPESGLLSGPQTMLWALMDVVVDGYLPVTNGLENDIDEIEVELFARAPGVAQRIYELSGEITNVLRAARPIVPMCDALLRGAQKYSLDVELNRLIRDVQDHAIRIVERAENQRTSLQNALTVHSALVSEQQNEEMKRMTEASLDQAEAAKKISSWAAILFTPSLIGSIYGMNFVDMPELHWRYGYPMSLMLMLALSLGLYLIFKYKKWL